MDLGPAHIYHSIIGRVTGARGDALLQCVSVAGRLFGECSTKFKSFRQSWPGLHGQSSHPTNLPPFFTSEGRVLKTCPHIINKRSTIPASRLPPWLLHTLCSRPLLPYFITFQGLSLDTYARIFHVLAANAPATLLATLNSVSRDTRPHGGLSQNVLDRDFGKTIFPALVRRAANLSVQGAASPLGLAHRQPITQFPLMVTP